MPTRCELIAKAKEKGLKGYSKMKKPELQALVEGGKAVEKKKTYPIKIKAKQAPLKASGSARRVKAKDTEAGKAQAKALSGFMGKAEEGRDKRVRGTADKVSKSAQTALMKLGEKDIKFDYPKSSDGPVTMEFENRKGRDYYWDNIMKRTKSGNNLPAKSNDLHAWLAKIPFPKKETSGGGSKEAPPTAAFVPPTSNVFGASVSKTNPQGLDRAAMNKMNPLELFGQLPGLAKLNILNPKATGVKVGKPLDDQVLEAYGDSRYLRGVKAGDTKKAVNEIQNKHFRTFSKKKGKEVGQQYAWRTMGDLVRLVKKQPQGGAIMKDMIELFRGQTATHRAASNAISEKQDAKRQKVAAVDAPNMNNIFQQHFQFDEMPYESHEYVGNIIEGMTYNGDEPGARRGASDAARERLYDKVSGWETQRVKRSIGAFIKGKGFTTGTEAYNAYNAAMNQKGDYYSELDNFI